MEITVLYHTHQATAALIFKESTIISFGCECVTKFFISKVNTRNAYSHEWTNTSLNQSFRNLNSEDKIKQTWQFTIIKKPKQKPHPSTKAPMKRIIKLVYSIPDSPAILS
ncbi:Rap guanine nucleotide exchange factor 4 [Trichinella spiralis]|uniref:Rap guanine nucleotide exchange factor 4 n=1 Tax=Trichinella spiralis TaxID=6334 RepID=UPI0001EFC280|nr:Rap guanine nucleotide exchange factor 4 [Trichinella spiralis]